MEDVQIDEYGDVIFKGNNADAFNMWLDIIEEKEKEKEENIDKKLNF